MRLPFKNLVDLLKAFPDEQTCIDFIAEVRWAGKPYCPHCGNDNKIYKLGNPLLWKCSKCRQPFSIKVGTIFNESKISLQKWFMAIYLITAHKKGISSLQLGKDIGVTQKTAWFMNHRIRYALTNKSFDKLNGLVEIDETYVGGKAKNQKYKPAPIKTAVVGMIEREGNVRVIPVINTDNKTLVEVIKDNVDSDATLISDEHSGYSTVKTFMSHNTINHSVEYANGDIHTNTIEGFWSQLKRGIIGIYHQVSPKHLHRYCDEFAYRYNTRVIKDNQRFEYTFMRLSGRLDYKTLTERQ
jgi:transposase-like protein